jgi:hypothetical protein
MIRKEAVDAPNGSGAQWRPVPSPVERAAQLLADERAGKGIERRAFALAILGCVVSAGAGTLLIAWSLHTTEAQWAGAAFWGGLVIGYGGISATLASAFRYAEEQGLL